MNLSSLFQHTGEEWFSFGWHQYALVLLLVMVYLLLTFKNKLPSMTSFKDFADVINSAGGHIILLAMLAIWSIAIAMQFFYHILSLPQETVDKSQSIITAGITYVQGTLTGAFVGALLKTMTGGAANGKPPSTSVTVPTDSTASVAITNTSSVNQDPGQPGSSVVVEQKKDKS